ncbi:CHAT domain-containing protein [Aquimarina sp. D1M17]|uniref:CHAT domain-containing protein n=1 Tax=Aquimarina acroporae TaxID=2937283 RepID=UPI0020C178F0|nr:CHAT domain-containing tetratricopeptide repeat protein [Aquimarina acroporae]MCK8522161.1 CHAT domain-containing protein [Aquimarina acroporae]
MKCTTPTFLIKFFALPFFILCIHFSSYGQNKQDTLVAYRHLIEGDKLLNKWNLDSAITHFNKALKTYQKTGNKKRTADIFDKISKVHLGNFDLNDAFENAQNAMHIRMQLFGKNHPITAISYNHVGYILKEQDQFQKALDYFNKALEIQIKVYGEDSYHTADSQHNIGIIYHRWAQYDKGLVQYDKALKIRVKKFGKNHKKIADSYIDIGTTHYHLGNRKKAIYHYQMALKIRQKVYGENSPEVAFCYNHIGNILTLLSQYEKAQHNHEKSLKIIEKSFNIDHPYVALCLYSMAVNLRLKGEHNKTLPLLEKSLDILKNKLGKMHSKTSSVLVEISLYYAKKGLYKKSLKYQLETLAVDLEVYPKNHSFIGSCYNNLGNLYRYNGEHNKALSYLKKANKIYIPILGEEHGAVARVYNNIANIHKAIKDYDKALAYYQKAVEIRIKRKGRYHEETSFSFQHMADVFKEKKNYEKALIYYHKALEIQKKAYGNLNYFICDTQNDIASTFVLQKKYDLALVQLRESLKIRLKTDGKHHPRTAKSYNQIADLHKETKEYDKALLFYDKAIKANRYSKTESKINLGQLPKYLDNHILLYSLHGKTKTLQRKFETHRDTNDLIECVTIFKEADTLIHKIRNALRTHADKIDFAEKTKQIYTDAIENCLLLAKHNQKSSFFNESFYYIEKSRANTLLGLLGDSKAKNFSGIPRTILDLEHQLKTDHAFYTSEIVNERTLENPDTLKITIAENKLFETSRRKDSLIESMEKRYPKYYQLKYKHQTVSIAEIQEKLGQNTTVLEFFNSDSITYAYVITNNDFSITKINTQNLEDNIRDLKYAINSKNTNTYKKVAFDLYSKLIAPIQDNIRGDHLIIIPDGPLWHLNFELLLTEETPSNNPKNFPYLLKEYAISYANSSTLLFSEKTLTPNQKTKKCLAFSYSDSTKMFDTQEMSLATLRDAKEDLPGTRQEIKAISEIINGKYYFGNQAIESNFKKNAGQYNILHMAMHGEIDHKRPENSRLLFTKSNDSIEDNFLYSHELFALNIPAELTVLSACNTGAGKIATGEGIMSLGNAFQYSGTKSLLLSSWKVPDQTTPDLMKYFYSNLKNGMRKDKALQQAKLQCLNTFESNQTHPFYWGGFYLVGDTTPLDFEESSNLFWWLLGLSLVLTIGIGLFIRKKATQV